MTYEIKFLISLFFALVVEISIVLWLIKYIYKYKGINNYKIVFIGLIATALTMPYVWYILPPLIINRQLYIILSELLAISIEGFLYAKLLDIKTKEAFIISFIANIASVFLSFYLL